MLFPSPSHAMGIPLRVVEAGLHRMGRVGDVHHVQKQVGVGHLLERGVEAVRVHAAARDALDVEERARLLRGARLVHAIDEGADNRAVVTERVGRVGAADVEFGVVTCERIVEAGNEQFES